MEEEKSQETDGEVEATVPGTGMSFSERRGPYHVPTRVAPSRMYMMVEQTQRSVWMTPL